MCLLRQHLTKTRIESTVHSEEHIMRGSPADGTSPTDPSRSQQANGTVSGDGRANGIEGLSRLMLEGWTMLADTCPRTDCHMPLARSREGRVYCCACQANIVPAAEASEPEPESTAGRTSPLAASAPSSSADPGTVVAVRGGSSGAGLSNTGGELSVPNAGDKVLQGWTRTNRTCATCATPLLRSPTGALLCVQCASSPPTAAPASNVASQAPPLPAPQARAQLPAPRPDAHSPLLLTAPDAAAMGANTDSTYAELCAAEQAVVAALRTLRAGLPMRRDVDGIASIVRAIRDAAATIEQLRRARSSVLGGL